MFPSLYETLTFLAIRAGIHKIHVRIAIRKDPDQTLSSEAIWNDYELFVKTFLAGNQCFKF